MTAWPRGVLRGVHYRSAEVHVRPFYESYPTLRSVQHAPLRLLTREQVRERLRDARRAEVDTSGRIRRCACGVDVFEPMAKPGACPGCGVLP